MSLIHWWPLTEDLNDKIANVKISGTYNGSQDGKIGMCLQTKSSSYTTNILLNDKWNHQKQDVSMSCWIKINQEECNNYIQTLNYTNLVSMTHPTGCVIGQTSYGGLGIYWRSNNAIYNVETGEKSPLQSINCRAYTRGEGTIVESQAYTIPFDTWVHLTLVANYSDKTLSFYVDGQRVGNAMSYNNLPTITGNRPFRIAYADVYGGNGPGGYLPMKINDVRLYDHALSVAEIQELKKALVIHYTFDDVLANATTNLITSPHSGQHVSSAASNEYNHAGLILTDEVPHGTYTLSGEYKISPTDSATSPKITFLVRYNDVKNYIALGRADIVRDNEWHRFSITATTDPEHEMGYLAAWVFDYKTPGNDRECYARNLQIELNDHATAYTPNARNGMLYNESGLVQPEKVENLTITTDTNIGSFAGNFQSNPHTLITTPLDINGHTDLTIACWAYLKSGGTLGSRAIYHIVNGSSLEIYAYGRSNNWLRTPITLNEWNHIAITYSATKRTIYINGVEKASDSIDGTFTRTPYLDLGYDTSTNGRILNGLISDYRVYTTCLNPEEIKELYACGGRISNLGDAISGSFIQAAGPAKVNKNHTIQAENFYEHVLPSNYIGLEYVDFTIADSIDTGVAPGTNLVFDVMVENITSGAYILTQGNYGLRLSTYYTNFVSKRRFKIIDFTSFANTTYRIQGSNDFIRVNKIDGIEESDDDTPAGNALLFNGLQSAGRLYFCKMWNKDKLIRDFIPAKRIEDNCIGLYDAISKTFFTSAGLTGKELSTQKASFTAYNELISRNIIEK